MRQLLISLEMTSNGTTAKWNPAGGQDDAEGPPGGINPPHLLFHWRYTCCWGDTGRAAVLKEAATELDRIRGTYDRKPATPETLSQRNQRMLEEGAGWEPRVVARNFRCAERDVIKARLCAGLTADYGTAPDPEPEPIDQLDKARQMRRRGMSFRAIEQVTRVSKSTLERHLKAAA
jgi:hypothetical protein